MREGCFRRHRVLLFCQPAHYQIIPSERVPKTNLQQDPLPVNTVTDALQCNAVWFDQCPVKLSYTSIPQYGSLCSGIVIRVVGTRYAQVAVRETSTSRGVCSVYDIRWIDLFCQLRVHYLAGAAIERGKLTSDHVIVSESCAVSSCDRIDFRVFLTTEQSIMKGEQGSEIHEECL